MKLRAIIALALAFALLLVCGCGKDENKEEDIKAVVQSPNFAFTEDMMLYMTSYTHMMLEDEMSDAGVDMSLPLSEQMRSEEESWEDYLYTKTVENIEKILLYCESAYLDEYAITEGMLYKANESISYISDLAEEGGITAEEYIRLVFGDKVTMEGYETCTQMMALCEGYELDLMNAEKVEFEDIVTIAGENPMDYLKFDALRFTTEDKAVADRLAASEDKAAFLKIISGLSGIDMTDSDKNGIPDSVHAKGAVVSSDIAGEFAIEEGRAVGDTTVYESDGTYTVTMLQSLPNRNNEPLWDFRMIFISSESSSDPELDVTSLLDQWKEKAGGEEGFSNLAARYSDDPAAYYGGLYSATSRSDMPTSEIAEWVCDSARVPGDTTAFSVGEDGAYMLYYIRGNVPGWQYEAELEIKNQRVEEKINGVKETLGDKIKVDEALMREIIKNM